MSNPDLFFGTSGPRDSRIAIVGEAWGEQEAAEHRPFVGHSGYEFRKMLNEAGIVPEECFMTNVVAARPRGNDFNEWLKLSKVAKGTPDFRGLFPEPIVVNGVHTLWKQLAEVKPNIIIAAGNWPLWALTSQATTSTSVDGKRVPTGIASWRGSMIYADSIPGLGQTRLVPIIHPAGIMRDWTMRTPTLQDLRARVRYGVDLSKPWRRDPAPHVVIDASFAATVGIFQNWLARAESGEAFRLVNDIETARQSFITCVGFADSESFAITTPFIRIDSNGFSPYWSFEQEAALVRLISRLLTHPNIHIEGQNYLYDTQFNQLFFGATPNLRFDTMLAHHLLFPGTPKGLDYLSSLYCDFHWYWKDDNKDWDLKGDLRQHLRYNAEDCLRQFEVGTVLQRLLQQAEMDDLYRRRLAVQALALRMMNHGVSYDHERKRKLALDLTTEATNMAAWFQSIIPQEIVEKDLQLKKTPKNTKWWDSPSQQKRYFGEILGLRLPLHRKTKMPTFGKEGLGILQKRHPEYIRIFEALKAYRSIGVFFNTFVMAGTDPDGKIRCSFNVCGTETFRWSSSANAFGNGTNLQNIPVGKEE